MALKPTAPPHAEVVRRIAITISRALGVSLPTPPSTFVTSSSLTDLERTRLWLEHEARIADEQRARLIKASSLDRSGWRLDGIQIT